VTAAAPPFRLSPRVQPAEAARAVALAQLDYALHGLERGDAEAIHEARKACKKLRALLRLIRPFLGRAYRSENTRLRDVGRKLSRGREAHVLVETADAIFGGDDRLDELAERIRQRPHPATAVSLREARTLLHAARERAAEWPIRQLSAGSLIVGLVLGYRRARQGWHTARRHPSAPLAFHEWRKAAKYHGYQSALVGPLWPEARSRARRLDKLSDLLGEHHDLHVLTVALRRLQPGLGSDELLALARGRIRERQHALAAASLELGALLFRHKPLEWLEAGAR
jgi:CHAD domain-containing protein